MRRLVLIVLTTLLAAGCMADGPPAWLSADEANIAGAETCGPDVLVVRRDAGWESAEPRTNARYPIAVAVYVRDPAGYSLRSVVHAADAASSPWALRAARFLGALRAAIARRCKAFAPGIGGQVTDLWLALTGQGGGENWRNNLYVYDIMAQRSGTEWARTLAHELGHFLLPSASGYAAPESWGSGVLGERLFLKWLRDDLAAGRITAEAVEYVGARELGDFCDRQVTPLVERWQAAGPNMARLAANDKRAMDEWTALFLWADETLSGFAPTVLLDTLPVRSAAELRGPDFLAALERWIAGSAELTYRLPSTGGAIYLPTGSWLLATEPAQSSAAVVAVTGLQRSGPGRWTTPRLAAGWRITGWPGASSTVRLTVRRR